MTYRPLYIHADQPLDAQAAACRAAAGRPAACCRWGGRLEIGRLPTACALSAQRLATSMASDLYNGDLPTADPVARAGGSPYHAPAYPQP
jgi:hypothetical protein